MNTNAIKVDGSMYQYQNMCPEASKIQYYTQN